MTARGPFTQAMVQRAVRAARAEGLKVTGITVNPGGGIRIHTVDEVPVKGKVALTIGPILRDAREKLGAH